MEFMIDWLRQGDWGNNTKKRLFSLIGLQCKIIDQMSGKCIWRLLIERDYNIQCCRAKSQGINNSGLLMTFDFMSLTCAHFSL